MNRDITRVIILAAQVFTGLLLAFALGRFTAAPALSGSPAAIAGPVRPADLQAGLDEAERAEEVSRLEKQLAALKKETAELKADKKELESKLSIAADTVNKQQIALREAQRRAEEAEWKAGRGDQ